MLYDTHCHPYLAKEKSQDHILESFFSGGGEYLNSIGVDIESSQKNINLAKKYTGVFASIGIHPTHCQDYLGKVSETIIELEELYNKNSAEIVAIGECGLDYHWLESISEKYNIPQDSLKQLQKDFFRAQIGLAKKLNLPLIIHNRSAKEDVYEILTQEDFHNFVFHCYSENLEYAQKLLLFAPECKLGFGGVMTFKSALDVQQAAKNIPLENIIIETDAPYLTPTPHRGKQENEPLYTKYVLDSLATLRDEDFETIQKVVFENSINFFKIKRA